MNRYRLEFRGRGRNAIGALHPIMVVVAAPNYVTARLRAYDAHEHIVGGVEGVRATLLPAVASADG
jgi:hypothetical protein